MQVLGTIVLRNETPVPLLVQGIRAGITMNGIQVIPDVDLVPQEPLLTPGQDTPVTFRAALLNQKLVEWWPTHVQHGEETGVTLKLGITIVLPSALPMGNVGLGNNIKLPLVPVLGS